MADAADCKPSVFPEKPPPDAPAAGSIWNEGLPPGWKMLDFQNNGGFGKDRVASFEHRIGDFGKSSSLIFPEGSDESGGIIPQPEGFSTESAEDLIKIERSPLWLGSPEMLRPGARIRVGIHGAYRDDEVKFDVELPSLVQPR